MAKAPSVWIPSEAEIAAELERRAACQWYQMFLDDGPFRRELYPKHVAFMRAGATWRSRAMCAGNRVGKTRVAAYELTCHLTGEYPHWWEGKRFDHPIEAWAAGDTGQTTRNIIQVAMLGPLGTIESKQWSGMIPRALVYDVSRKPGIPDAVSTIWVNHKSGGKSVLDLLSFDQKREAFQGTAKHVIWEDEESDNEIHGECLMRTMTTNGIVMVTMTPLMGLTPFISEWLEKSVIETFDADGKSLLVPARSQVYAGEGQTTTNTTGIAELTRYMVMASWDDCPHLDEKAKSDMLAEYPLYQQEARRRGIPALGSGAIYPLGESQISVAPFAIPDHWPRAFAMDLDAGAGWTAAAWMAWDRETDTDYVYDVYKRSHAEPVVHAEAIKSRGKWIPGLADAAALLVTGADATQYVNVYRKLGLDVNLPQKAVEAGIQHVWSRLSAGKLKVFTSCGAFFEEYRLYRRDDKGRIVKKNDHVLDSVRYLAFDNHKRFKTKPGAMNDEDKPRRFGGGSGLLGWLGT